MKNHYTRALVTGGAGFIGSHLVTSLLNEGLEVISIDNYIGGKKENLAHLSNNKDFSEINCDILDVAQLRQYFEDVDLVYHLACSKNTVCMKDPLHDLEVNAKGTLNVLLLAKEAGVKKFVHASTGSVYGNSQYYPTDELHPLNPISYYGVSKLAGEKYARLFNDLHGLNTTLLRFFNVFGPRQEYSEVGGVISIFARRAQQDLPLIIYGDGTQTRSFTYVEDIVRIAKMVALREETAGEVYNCGSSAQVSISEVAQKVLEYYEKEDLRIEYRNWKAGDIKKYLADNRKIRDLGFEFEFDFELGLEITLAWSRQYFSKNESLVCD